MSIVGIVFMQLGDATRQGRLTRSDGFYNLVQGDRVVVDKQPLIDPKELYGK